MTIEYSLPKKQPELPIQQRKPYRQSKCWMLAKRRKNNQHLQLVNSNTESAYHRLLLKVKELYGQQHEYVFERDYKYDRTESLVKMHLFQCESLSLELICCFDEFYYLNYHFDNCPFEQEIIAFIKANQLTGQSRNLPIDSGFFARTMQNQDKSFFYSL